MKRTWAMLGLAVVFLLIGRLEAADENPLKAAKVGDWVSTKTTIPMPTGKRESTMKQTVIAKDEKEVTIKIENTVMGQASSQEMKIPLDKPYEPGVQPGGQFEKIAEGDETITVGAKEYKCHWVQAKVTTEMGGQKIQSESKVWTCKDIPLGGMVKMEAKVMGMNTTTEMTGCGRGK